MRDCITVGVDEDAIRVRCEIAREDVSRADTIYGTRIDIEGFHQEGEIGGPGLPARMVKVAVPYGHVPGELRVDEAAPVRLTDEPVLVAPLRSPGLAPDLDRILRGARDKMAPEPFTRFPIPDAGVREDLYRSADMTRRPVVEVTATELIGQTLVATLVVRPVRADEDGRLLFTPGFEAILPLAPAREPALTRAYKRAFELGRRFQPPIASAEQARRLEIIAKGIVVNPDLVAKIDFNFPPAKAEYVIITDDQTWDADRIAPNGSAPGMIEAFSRLIQHKRSRGLTARLVTISAIVNGTFGDFKTGARDLQEVIRGFLKSIHARWGTAWVLLGGATTIVPTRYVVGAAWGPLGVVTDTKPADGNTSWSGAYTRLHWSGAPALTDIVRTDTGLRIRRGAGAATLPRWDYVTDDTYATISATPTTFVRIDGAAGDVNGPMSVVTFEDNTIPTDFYYASLIGSSYGLPGVHDWDLLDNGVYGQHTGGGQLDGVKYAADVSVGRAPSRTAADARTFVTKVITYETLKSPDGEHLGNDWRTQVVYAASEWGSGRIGLPPSPALADDTYTAEAGVSRIQLKVAPTAADFHLVAYVSDTDMRPLPYSTTGRGFHFVADATSTTPSEKRIGAYAVPIPTRWILVRSTDPSELGPALYIYDPKVLDLSVADTEKLRAQVEADFSYDASGRFYEDDLDVPASSSLDPPRPLSVTELKAALNQGPHLVCMSGHGNPGFCVGLGPGDAGALANGSRAFIAYADSCLTNHFDSPGTLGEAFVNNPNGGAVAYLGNSRYGWIGVGAQIERPIFSKLKAVRHLGLAFDARCFATTTYMYWYTQWSIFALNLLGDPEMPVWVEPEIMVRPPIDIPIRRLRIRIPSEPPGNPWDRRIVLRQGDRVEGAPVDVNGDAIVDRARWQPAPIDLVATDVGRAPIFHRIH